MFRVIPLLILLLVVSCSTDIKENAEIFDYKDFGPQVIANEIIGMEWWQWQPHGESRPPKYDIKVVVYRSISLDDVKKKYPLNPEQEKDYRYLEYDVALTYLDEKISENIIEKVTADLKKTKLKLTTKLGD